MLQLVFTRRISFHRNKLEDREELSIDGRNVTQNSAESSDNGGSTEQKVVQWSGDGEPLLVVHSLYMSCVLTQSTDDPDNPQNWPVGQKIWITSMIKYAIYALISLLANNFSACTPSLSMSAHLFTLPARRAS